VFPAKCLPKNAVAWQMPDEGTPTLTWTGLQAAQIM